MEPKENLYYGFGNIAYAVAKADGEVQASEYNKFHDIVSKGVKDHDIEFDFSDIIFHILKKEDMSSETAYEWGVDAMKIGKDFMSEKKLDDFTNILQEVAAAFNSVTEEENDFIQRFRKDAKKLIKK